MDNTTIYEQQGITASTGLNATEREIAKYNEVVYIEFFVYNNSNTIKNGDVIGHITDSKFYPRKNLFLTADYGERYGALSYCGTAKIDTTGNITFFCSGSVGYGEVSVRGSFLLCQPVN